MLWIIRCVDFPMTCVVTNKVTFKSVFSSFILMHGYLLYQEMYSLNYETSHRIAGLRLLIALYPPLMLSGGDHPCSRKCASALASGTSCSLNVTDGPVFSWLNVMTRRAGNLPAFGYSENQRCQRTKKLPDACLGPYILGIHMLPYDSEDNKHCQG